MTNKKKSIKEIKEKIIENLENKEMEKYFVLSYDRGDIIIISFEAEDRDKASEIFEEEMQTNFSTDWLLDENDFDKLVDVVKKFKK